MERQTTVRLTFLGNQLSFDLCPEESYSGHFFLQFTVTLKRPHAYNQVISVLNPVGYVHSGLFIEVSKWSGLVDSLRTTATVECPAYLECCCILYCTSFATISTYRFGEGLIFRSSSWLLLVYCNDLLVWTRYAPLWTETVYKWPHLIDKPLTEELWPASAWRLIQPYLWMSIGQSLRQFRSQSTCLMFIPNFLCPVVTQMH